MKDNNIEEFVNRDHAITYMGSITQPTFKSGIVLRGFFDKNSLSIADPQRRANIWFFFDFDKGELVEINGDELECINLYYNSELVYQIADNVKWHTPRGANCINYRN